MSNIFYVERITRQVFLVHADTVSEAVMGSFSEEPVHVHLNSVIYDQQGVLVGDTDDGHSLEPRNHDLFEDMFEAQATT